MLQRKLRLALVETASADGKASKGFRVTFQLSLDDLDNINENVERRSSLSGVDFGWLVC